MKLYSSLPGLLTKKQRCKQIVWVTERQGLPAWWNKLLTYMQYIYHNLAGKKTKQCISTTQQQYPSTIQQYNGNKSNRKGRPWKKRDHDDDDDYDNNNKHHKWGPKYIKSLNSEVVGSNIILWERNKYIVI